MKVCIKSKYKIAYIMHRGEVSTYGGFPQHVEHSIYGLKKLGHDVDFFFLGNADKSNEQYVKSKLDKYHKGELSIEGQLIKELDKGIGTGAYFHVNFGWIYPITPIKTLKNKLDLKEKLETYDAVFWHTPFWFKQKSMQKDTDWPLLLDLKNPVNIGFHHDGNIRANSAWMHFIDKYFDRFITVHPASYNALKVFKTPRCMIFNPQILSNVDRNVTGWRHIEGSNNLNLFSLQYWKGSKHVDDFVRAIPHIHENIDFCNFILAGKGLEYAYMNSEDKILDQYIGNVKNDPDIKECNVGEPIIKTARKNGAITPLWLNSKERDEWFKKSFFFIDTAYYPVSKELGEHFSRTLIEAMMNGVVPIARNLALSNNDEGIGEIFKPNENYLMIPAGCTPKEFANKIIEYLTIDENLYNKIVQNNYELLDFFDIDFVCSQYVDVIRGEPTGWFDCYETGEPTDDFIKKAELQWYGDGEKRNFNFKKVS